MTTLASSAHVTKDVGTRLQNLTFDDLAAQLDIVIRDYNELSRQLTKLAARAPLTKARPSDVTTSISLQGLAQDSNTCPAITSDDTPENIKAALDLQARGINPVTGEKDLIGVRTSIPSRKKKGKQDTAGKGWFDMPRTVLTPELKKDLNMISMRAAIDSKRFYKKDKSSAKVPQFSHVGHIMEGSTEFYSARLSKKDRKRTIVEEVLAEEKATKKHKRKYQELMAANQRDSALGRSRIKRKKK